MDLEDQISATGSRSKGWKQTEYDKQYRGSMHGNKQEVAQGPSDLRSDSSNKRYTARQKTIHAQEITQDYHRPHD